MLTVGCTGSEKTNALPNIINNESNIDKMCLYGKDPHELKYQLLIKKEKEHV